MITDAERERAASNGQIKTVYEITRVLSNESRGTLTAIKDKEGKILRSQEEREKVKRDLPRYTKPATTEPPIRSGK